MVWVKFTGDFRFKPRPTVTQFFPKGLVMNVTTPCADAAKAAGKAEEVEKPKRNAKASAAEPEAGTEENGG